MCLLRLGSETSARLPLHHKISILEVIVNALPCDMKRLYVNVFIAVKLENVSFLLF